MLHGDSHLGNTFVDGDEVGRLDWTSITLGPGLRDFAYYVCNSLPVKRRQHDEGALLRRYLGALESGGGPRIEEEAAICDLGTARLLRDELGF